MGQDDRSLVDLTRQMGGWLSANPTQLHLNDALVTTFLGEVDAAQAMLASQLNGADGLHTWLASASVGTFESAVATRDHLQDDIREFITAVHQFHKYLNAVHAATDAARKNIQALDTPGG
ncbi:hypothetical protein A5634_21080 [Mycobacterium asiaticum]|uniref:Uncharacterized protein n=1 Tax=Mycobacterium asiaticum TaxID=1790 RepID=A0A1A3P3C3_MYCAS|nr:hypothetical protein [Mycobacterium asiaticum]OBK28170.1 hypothetical protein A5634_21080 [Mycobacterium asiaticum]